MAKRYGRWYVIERVKPSGLPSWIAYASTVEGARQIVARQPEVPGYPVRIVCLRGKRIGQTIPNK